MENIDPHGQFFHVRVIVGMVTGLAVARLLSALARSVPLGEQTGRDLLQIGWCLFLTLYVVHFWWFEYGFSRNPGWGFATYAFIVAYAALLYFISAVLLPEKPVSEPAQQSHVIVNRRWFYALLILVMVFDLLDSRAKGSEYFAQLGIEYRVRQFAMIVAAAGAVMIQTPLYHAALVVVALLSQLYLIVRLYAYLG